MEHLRNLLTRKIWENILSLPVWEICEKKTIQFRALHCSLVRERVYRLMCPLRVHLAGRRLRWMIWELDSVRTFKNIYKKSFNRNAAASWLSNLAVSNAKFHTWIEQTSLCLFAEWLALASRYWLSRSAQNISPSHQCRSADSSVRFKRASSSLVHCMPIFCSEPCSPTWFSLPSHIVASSLAWQPWSQQILSASVTNGWRRERKFWCARSFPGEAQSRHNFLVARFFKWSTCALSIIELGVIKDEGGINDSAMTYNLILEALSLWVFLCQKRYHGGLGARFSPRGHNGQPSCARSTGKIVSSCWLNEAVLEDALIFLNTSFNVFPFWEAGYFILSPGRSTPLAGGLWCQPVKFLGAG